MKLTYSITVDAKRLLQIGAQAQAKAERVLDVAALNIEANAKRNSPVDTGALRASIHVAKDGKLSRIIGDGVEYGVYQEFGTSRMPGRPWLGPAMESQRDAFLAAWKAIV